MRPSFLRDVAGVECATVENRVAQISEEVYIHYRLGDPG